MNSLTCKEKTFKEIEREFFEIGCEIARELMAAFLSKVDKEFGEARDKSQLRHKGKRNTSIKTLMGEVPVRRALYKRIKEDGSVEYIHLLDEAFQTISHQGVWNVVQAAGEKQKEAEEQLINSFKNNGLSGNKEVPVLFEEADGLWLSMQGKSRKGSTKGKKEQYRWSNIIQV